MIRTKKIQNALAVVAAVSAAASLAGGCSRTGKRPDIQDPRIRQMYSPGGMKPPPGVNPGTTAGQPR